MSSRPYPPGVASTRTAPATTSPSQQLAKSAAGQPAVAATGSTGTDQSPTPRLLSALRNLSVALCLIFTGLTMVGTLTPRYQLSYAVGDFQQGQLLRDTRTQLAQADQIAATAFLAERPPAEELERFQSTMSTVSTNLIQAASHDSTDARELANVQEQVNTYRRYVDSAIATSASDPAAGAHIFTGTSSTLNAPMDALATLAMAADQRADSRFTTTFGTLAVAAGWISVAVLMLTSVVTARRTHRALNPGLAGAIVLLLAATLLLNGHQTTISDSLGSAEKTSIVSARSAANARTAAFRAQAAESRHYLAPSSGFDKLWKHHDHEVLQALDGLNPSTLQTSPSQAWSRYQAAHKTSLVQPNARSLGRSDQPSSTLGLMTSFTKETTKLETDQGTAATQTIVKARDPLIAVMIICLLCGLGAVGATAWGVNQRLAEYR